MRDRLFLVNVEPPEIRVAELRHGRLHDLDVERDGRMLGNIYKGRAENVLPGMDAAFIEIGQKRNALLYVGDLAPDGSRSPGINALLKSGDELLVQVARPAVGAKGARVTTRISLPGRFGILISNSETAGISKRIETEDERARLRRIADKLRPLDHGLILRTEAEGASEAAIAADVHLLCREMAAIRERASQERAPTLIHQDLGVLGRLARDRLNDQVSEIFIDSAETLERLRQHLSSFAPELASRLVHHVHPDPIFTHYKVEDDVQLAAQRVVPLSQGGSLILEEGETLAAVDVNTGSFVGKKGLGETVLQTNLQAVDEIARQLRLRDIGGIIVIDFIDMERTRDRVKVLNALEAALKEDRAKTRIVQISPSGLVEMTRRRESHSLRSLLNEPCSLCGGSGVVQRPETVAIEARRRARDLALRHPDEAVLVRLHPETACWFLGEDNEWARELETALGPRLLLRVNAAFSRDTVHVDRYPLGTPVARDLKPETLFTLGPGTTLYPRDVPRFAVLGESLVDVTAVPYQDAVAKGQTVPVEIAAQDRLYAVARVPLRR